MKKAELLQLLEKRRVSAFDNEHHKFENKRMAEAIAVIDGLCPPDLFEPAVDPVNNFILSVFDVLGPDVAGKVKQIMEQVGLKKQGYHCTKCGGISPTSTVCENPSCPNQPCCDQPKDDCICHKTGYRKHIVPGPKGMETIIKRAGERDRCITIHDDNVNTDNLGERIVQFLNKENNNGKQEILLALREFCERVDKGEVRSVKTYGKFKELLEKYDRT